MGAVKDRTVRAGHYRHILEIQEPTVVKDSYQEARTTWATIATRRGAVKALSGVELIEAQQQNAQITHRIEMRYYSAAQILTANFQILFRGRTFRIISAWDEQERFRKTIVMAVETQTGTNSP